MEIKPYRATNKIQLYEYWQALGADIPYFFPVPIETWAECLLQDRLEGELIFKILETHLAIESGQVLGFIQYGKPAFAWDTHGLKYPDPKIGVIRQLYFESDRVDAGEALLALALDALATFDSIHAFYHIMGMRCTVHHGKLHSSQSHVENLILANGFQVEHQNGYFVLDLSKNSSSVEINPQINCRYGLHIQAGEGTQDFEARLDGNVVGTAVVSNLADLTDGGTQHLSYLTWLGVEDKYRGQGIGAVFLSRLGMLLASEGIRFLHTDTAAENFQAIRLYKKLGFEQKGSTSSFIRIFSDE
jgi:ribosomal protein S18 acetylase RimI-like enzyme